MGIGATALDVYRALAAAGRLKLRVYAFGSRRGRPTRCLAAPAGAGAAAGACSRCAASSSTPTARSARAAPRCSRPTATIRRTAGLDADAAEPSSPSWRARAVVRAAGRSPCTPSAIAATATCSTPTPQAGVGPAQRFRIEHAQVVALDDIPRFAKLGVIASMQPTHATSDSPWAEKRLGAARLAGAYAWRRMLDAGVHLAFGSDFPVEEVERRRRPARRRRARRLDRRPEAHARRGAGAFTRGAAYAAFEEAVARPRGAGHGRRSHRVRLSGRRRRAVDPRSCPISRSSPAASPTSAAR